MGYIYVLDIDGNPLMPTNRNGMIRKKLKSGKMEIVDYHPFAVRLLYDSTHFLQELTLGVDPGRTNIGLAVVKEDGTCLMSIDVETRNKMIRKLLEERKAHRRASRYGERRKRQRLAIKFNKMLKSHFIMRKLPKCKALILCKYIINTQAKFCNRIRPSGWLTPTANHLLITHLNLFKKIKEYLPIQNLNLEINKFDFARMGNPGIKNWEYQKDKLFGFDTLNNAVDEMQNHKCLLCNNNIEHHHHIIPKSRNGSNTIENIVGLCKNCHDLVHKDSKIKEKLMSKKNGLEKRYGGISVLNQIMYRLIKESINIFDNVNLVTGYDTYILRNELGIDKDHYLDAYVIAISNIKNPAVNYSSNHYEIKQFRRQDRSVIKAQTERIYKLDGKVVAKNRRKRTEQTCDSLRDWYFKVKKEFGIEKAKSLQKELEVIKSIRRYNDLNRVMPGTTFLYNNKRYVLSGTLTNGKYFRAIGNNKTNYPASKCKIIKNNEGLVFI